MSNVFNGPTDIKMQASCFRLELHIYLVGGGEEGS